MEYLSGSLGWGGRGSQGLARNEVQRKSGETLVNSSWLRERKKGDTRRQGRTLWGQELTEGLGGLRQEAPVW